MATRILLVDDHAMFRSGMKALLEAERGLEVVGEAANGDDGVDRVRELKPDVVVMDLSMPGSNGLDATRRIAALGLKARVLVLTVHAEEEYLVPVVEALPAWIVELEMVSVLRLVTAAPPLPPVELKTSTWFNVIWPALWIANPPPLSLRLAVNQTSDRETCPTLRRPPPKPLPAFPCSIRTPVMVTLAPDWTWKTRSWRSAA